LPETIWSAGHRDVIAGSLLQEFFTAEASTPSQEPVMKSNPFGKCKKTGGDGVLYAPWPILWAPKPHIINVAPGGASVDALAGVGTSVYAAVNAGLCKSGVACDQELATNSFYAPVVLRGNGTASLGSRHVFGLPVGFGHLRIQSMSVAPGGQVLASGWLMSPKRENCGNQAPNGGGVSATIWSNGYPTVLDSLIPTGSKTHLCDAVGINSHGQIVGSGEIDGVANSAYLLTPNGEAP
jgi:hypothetical protein